MDDCDLIRRERDTLLRILDLSSVEDPEAFLEEALDVLVTASRAQRGYVAIHDDGFEAGDAPALRVARAFDPGEQQAIESRISSGIIAEALATGDLIRTGSAMSDPRFDTRKSVRRNQIEAVLCAPVGRSGRGVVYVQGVQGGGMFTADDERLVSLIAQHLDPLVDRLLASTLDSADDPTEPFRRQGAFTALVGRSQALAEVMRLAATYARLDAQVLITGDTGVGKTLLAEEMHRLSHRAEGPFVQVNCAAIAPNLFEAELFGGAEGAYTGLHADKPGLVDAADGGTLLLDEVAELPQTLQAKLLQFIQDRTYHRLGDPRTRRADVRIIAATNIDLSEAVEQKAFRQDLYHRLDVLRIHLPALSDRRDDIPLLLESIGRRRAEAMRCPWPGVTPRVLRHARRLDWPGNVRELTNVVERALVKHIGDGPLDVEGMFDIPDIATLSDGPTVTLDEATRAFQRDFLRDYLDQVDWNMSKASRDLDVSRSHLYTLVAELGVKR